MTKRYFISDAHFGSGFGNDQERTTHFELLCDTLIGTNSELYILGDFFDFWIEYGHVIRTDYVKIVASLHNLTRHKIPVIFVRGNHDFMDYSYFTNELSITVLDGHNQFDFNGIKFRLCHGDDIAGDWKYRALHKILKSPLAQKAYKLFHPAIGVGLASELSALSRRRSSKSGRYLSDERQTWYHGAVNTLLKETGDQVLIMGHTHRADLTQLENSIYVNSGTWLNSPTVILLENRTLSILELNPVATPPFTTVKSLNIN